VVPAAGAQRQHVPRVIEIICMSGSMSGASPSARLKPLPPPAIKALGASMERKLPSHCLCGAAPKRTAHAEMEALMKCSIGLSHVLSGAMALCIACPVPEVTAAAAFLAATFTAHAQDTEVRRPPRKTRVTHDLRLHHRKRAEPAPSDSEGQSEAIRRLPDFFPNCEHPAPRWCNDNY
jgi:hypothetical protein